MFSSACVAEVLFHWGDWGECCDDRLIIIDMVFAALTGLVARLVPGMANKHWSRARSASPQPVEKARRLLVEVTSSDIY